MPQAHNQTFPQQPELSEAQKAAKLQADNNGLKEPEVPQYVTEHHLYLKDKAQIEDALKDPKVHKYIWHQIMILILEPPKDKTPDQILAELRAYASILPSMKSQESKQPQPKKI